ncbi:hypothetical protein EST38_g11813 [Candolleomyces aberdarensis]|uniref:G protein-coupled receptor n=1 Tax=Candolleomyces aberdarensis TaxID=2316362 RepID=A0A4Q2D3Z3_9AGAR|nr:hypothetical protein EST38_g11813 [Candolleomyces aberdarensis]
MNGFIGFIKLNAAEAALLLCLYALLGTKRRYLILLAVFFTSYTIVHFALLLPYTINSSKAIPSFPLDQRFGYACNFQMPSKITQNYWIVLRYVNLSRTAITACISIATLIIRYRRQNGSLINVIRRDGGMYYLGTIAIRVTDSVVTTSGFITILTEYRIVEVLSHVVIPMLVTRLLINMKKIGERREMTNTSRIISTLMFARRNQRDLEDDESVSMGGDSDTDIGVETDQDKPEEKEQTSNV